MVPYTLSKRYQDSKNRTTAKTKAAALRKAKKLNSKEEGDSDSDEGDEPVSFFSHLDESRPSSSFNTSSSTTHASDVSDSHSSSHSQPLTALESYSHPSTSTYEVTLTPLLANSAPLAPKPFRITEPNYDPITGIYSYGDSTTAPPETQYQGYEESNPEVSQTDSTSSQPQAVGGGGGWEQYYHQAEQDQQLTPSAEYLEAFQQQQQGQSYPSQQGPVKPMPGAGPGLSIDDDVVSIYKLCKSFVCMTLSVSSFLSIHARMRISLHAQWFSCIGRDKSKRVCVCEREVFVHVLQSPQCNPHYNIM